VRVWDCVGEGATKGEYRILSGAVYDIAWDGDSQRIIAVGEGKARRGHCFTWDSGNSVGEIEGHSNRINCVSVRQQRPIRAATGSDDTAVVFFHGVPFKINATLRGRHSRFVFGTAFSPDGATLVSVGGDRKIWLYDGKTAEPRGQIGEDVHTGSIFGVAWDKDSKRIATCSADQTVRIWDVEAGKAVTTWRMGEEGVVSVPHHQVGITWPARSDGLVISVDLDGNLNYLVEGNQKPERVVQGHQKNITASTLNSGSLYTASYEGRVCQWDIATGSAERVKGETHPSTVSGMAADPGSNKTYSVGWDDSLRSISSGSYTPTVGLIPGQPKGVATGAQGIVYVAREEAIEVFKDGKSVRSVAVKGATCIATSKSFVAVGTDKNAVHIYNISGDNLTAVDKELRKTAAAISTLSFSSNGKYLAAGTSSGKIAVYATDKWDTVTERWSAHNARITSIAWDPTGEWAVSGSLDTHVYVWSVADPGKRIKAMNTHKEGVSGVAWEKGKILTTGADATVKTWILEGV
jgi:WD repeat-containing protein 1 (actin-interacting protein 1)